MKPRTSPRFTPNDDVFPYFELSILFFASMTSAIPLTGLFPYIAFMVVDLHAAKNVNEAGYVSGYLASAFMFGRVVSSFYWGHIADTVGRKPVAYISCAAIIVFSITFGMSLNIYVAILSRLLLGILNPFNTLTKTLISDICSKKQQPMGMSLATGSWSVGLVIGPAIGGCLARPCLQYPSVFGGNFLFETFPYLLPNLVTSVMAAISMALVYLYLPETAPIFVNNSNIVGNSIDVEEGTRQRNEIDVEPGPNACRRFASAMCQAGGASSMYQSMKALIQNERVRIVCLAYFSISLSSIIFDEVFPLWAQSSRSVGGLGYTASTLGQIGSISGLPMMIVTFLIFPFISKKFGASCCFRVGQLLSTVFTCSTIFITLFHPSKQQTFPLLVLISSGSRCCAVVAFASTFLLINSSVPKDQIGAVNGLAMTIGGIAKFIGPFAASIVFAWSINNHYHSLPFNFTLIFFVCTCIGIVTCFLPISDNTTTTTTTGSGGSGGGSGGGSDINGIDANTKQEPNSGLELSQLSRNSNSNSSEIQIVVVDDSEETINDGTSHGLLARDKSFSMGTRSGGYVAVSARSGIIDDDDDIDDEEVDLNTGNSCLINNNSNVSILATKRTDRHFAVVNPMTVTATVTAAVAVTTNTTSHDSLLARSKYENITTSDENY